MILQVRTNSYEALTHPPLLCHRAQGSAKTKWKTYYLMRCLPWNKSMEPVSKTSVDQMNSTFWNVEHRLNIVQLQCLAILGRLPLLNYLLGQGWVDLALIHPIYILNLNYKPGLLMFESWRIAIEHNGCALNASKCCTCQAITHGPCVRTDLFLS